MPEYMSLDRREWSESTSDPTGYISPSLKRTRYLYKTATGQRVDIFRANAAGPDGGQMVIMPAPHNDRIGPVLETNASIFATQTGTDVVVPGWPGIVPTSPDRPFDIRGIRQSLSEVVAASRGNYDPMGKTMYEAIDTSIGFKKGQEIQFLGISLGAVAVIAILREMARYNPKGLKASRVDTFDAINSFGDMSNVEILKVLYDLATIEEPRRLVYAAQNDEIEFDDTAYPPASRLHLGINKVLSTLQSLTVYPTAMGIGKGLNIPLEEAMLDRTADGIGLHEADMTFNSGQQSSVSRLSDIEALADIVASRGGKAKVVEFVPTKTDPIEMGHHVLTAFGYMRAYATHRDD